MRLHGGPQWPQMCNFTPHMYIYVYKYTSAFFCEIVSFTCSEPTRDLDMIAVISALTSDAPCLFLRPGRIWAIKRPAFCLVSVLCAVSARRPRDTCRGTPHRSPETYCIFFIFVAFCCDGVLKPIVFLYTFAETRCGDVLKPVVFFHTLA